MLQHSGTGRRPPSGPVPAIPPPPLTPESAAAPVQAPLLRGALAWRDRSAAWIRRHSLVLDSALVVLLVAPSAPPLIVGRPGRADWVWAFVAALVLPLIWRRRRPFAVFLIIAATALVQLHTFGLLSADLSLLIAFYTVAAHQPGRRILIAAGLLEVGALLLVEPLHDDLAFWGWLYLTGSITAVGFTGYNVRTRRAYLVALEDRAARLERERDQQAQLAASAERARIAREMHDIVAHNLAVMIALADGAAYTAPQSLDQAMSVMGQVSNTGRSALADMRRLLGVLREPAARHELAGEHVMSGEHALSAEHGPAAEVIPAAGRAGAGTGRAPQPGLADLDDLLVTVRGAGLAVRLSESGNRAAPPAAQLAIYRIVQESLTNTLKHARATVATVRISYRSQAIELDVTDDGQASPGDHSGPGPGHGLTGMRERAAVFGGTVSAGPRPGGGWRVQASLNLDPAPERAAGPSAVMAPEGT